MITGRVRAPEINTRHGWLNTDRSYSLKDFRGKIVLLDFWTLGCINCQHIIPDLKRLEAEYPNELVVIGVHSAKFDNEKTRNAVRKALLKFDVQHPVVNDADFDIWRHYAVNAWPTVVLIDPEGHVIGQKAGENVYEVVKPNIDQLIEEFDDKLNREPLVFKPEESLDTPLRFPAKLIAGPDDTVFLSDSGHHRILQLSAGGQVLASIGTGSRGFTNGDYAEASFNEPQGLAFRGNLLYVADAKNNAIRIVDLQERRVATAAGNGELDYYFYNERWGEPVHPNSPWDLALDGDQMYIASAGNHQVLRMDLRSEQVFRFAGSGREALVNGPFAEACFNQPSALALQGHLLYVADAEASAIRVLDLKAETVTTLVGRGLFDFGDQDGPTDSALLQHAVGLSLAGPLLYVADTYNGNIKVVDTERKRVKTVLSGLDEPNDVKLIQGMLWITDTNHHQLLKVNPETWEKQLVPISKLVN
ncbi:MAG: thioredoxin-like domain-containing protein [Adhaeribacter sp.]